jgi:hypothetical protein
VPTSKRQLAVVVGLFEDGELDELLCQRRAGQPLDEVAEALAF